MKAEQQTTTVNFEEVKATCNVTVRFTRTTIGDIVKITGQVTKTEEPSEESQKASSQNAGYISISDGNTICSLKDQILTEEEQQAILSKILEWKNEILNT